MSVALSSLFVGVLTLSGVSWTPTSLAQNAGLQPAPMAAAPASALPMSFAALAEQLGPTVVNIQVTKVAPVGDVSEMPWPEGPSAERFRRFFRDRMPQPHRLQGNGSGVIISPDGHILTNNHVVEGAQEVTVTMADGRTYKGQMVGRDPKTDLAVLKIGADASLPVAPMGDSTALKVGEWVVAIGNPFGLGHTVTAGIVSAKGRVIGAGPYDDFIQTDAPINPGNSGGPLFNTRGQMVGINTAIVASGQGIGFAIPIDMAKPLIPQLVSTGTVTRGYLGVSIQSVTPELAKAMKLDERQGALVAEVTAGSPAAQAGIRQGDVIVGLNDTTVKDAHDLPALVAKTPAGEQVTVTLRRDGKTQNMPVTIGALPAEHGASATPHPEAPSQWGLQLQEVTPQMARRHGLAAESGVLVVGVQPGSPAERAGLRSGDLIREVNRQPVSSLHELREAIAKAAQQEALLLLVERDQGSIFVALAK